MKYILVILLAAVPLFEQKAAIPFGLHKYNIDPISVFLLTWVGCLLPIILIKN